jgi:hypothetical protein
MWNEAARAAGGSLAREAAALTPTCGSAAMIGRVAHLHLYRKAISLFLEDLARLRSGSPEFANLLI